MDSGKQEVRRGKAGYCGVREARIELGGPEGTRPVKGRLHGQEQTFTQEGPV